MPQRKGGFAWGWKCSSYGHQHHLRAPGATQLKCSWRTTWGLSMNHGLSVVSSSHITLWKAWLGPQGIFLCNWKPKYHSLWQLAPQLPHSELHSLLFSFLLPVVSYLCQYNRATIPNLHCPPSWCAITTLRIQVEALCIQSDSGQVVISPRILFPFLLDWIISGLFHL